MKGYYRQLRKLLEEAGCTLVRYGKGDHQVWYSPVTKQNVIVDGGVVSRHSANGVLKQAGLKKAF
ncbi:MAG TPA: type II toxin-antitoxin system HicA family toxin [Devosia sp.]|nr:type II toxin-antitoxin system HicA family toxin [Devosia sp.]